MSGRRLNYEGSNRGHGVERIDARIPFEGKQFQVLPYEQHITNEQIRMVAFLWLVKGWNREEIAKHLGLSIGQVKSQIGGSNSLQWASAIGDLIVAGFDIESGRSIRRRRGARKAEKTRRALRSAQTLNLGG